MQFTFMTGVLAHWLACVWGFIGTSSAGEWTGYDDGGSTWRQKHNVGLEGRADPLSLYGVALYVALNNVFGGSCEINPANYAEFYVQVVASNGH